MDAIVHLGWYAIPGDGNPDEQGQSLYRTQNLLWIAADVPGFVFASTASVYGSGLGFIESSPTFPGCRYTAAKVVAEEEVARTRGRNHLILRFGSFMGVGSAGGRTRTDLVVNAFASAGWSGRPIDVWDPESIKPIVDVRDAARVVVRGVEQSIQGIMNVATECRRAMDLARTVVDVVRSDGDVSAPEIRVVPNESGRGVRSTGMLCRRLKDEFPDVRLRSARESIVSMKGYRG
jgi:nucleoside-diphosphate-sugar epimerase